MDRNASLDHAFHGDYEPKVLIQKENHKHRVILDLALTGMKQIDIARQLGLTEVMVSYTLNQPWAREYMIEKSNNNTGLAKIRRMLEEQAPIALEQVISMSNDETIKKELQFKANVEILDRYLGKSAQPIVSFQGKPSEMSDAELDAAIKEKLGTN